MNNYPIPLSRAANPHQQEGAVLFVALILLVVLTMLGISAMDATKMETKMAANMKEYNHAFQAAEIGLTIPQYSLTQLGEVINSGGVTVLTKQDITREDIIGIDDQAYDITVGVAAAEGIYDPPASDLPLCGTETCKVRYFKIMSTGRSTLDDDAAEVTLANGIMIDDIFEKNTLY